MGNIEELEKLKERISQSGLFISRIPKPTKELFKKIAEEEWSNDYGMFLTYLLKFYHGECSSGHEELHAKIEYLAEELDKIKEVLSKKEEPKKRESLAQRNKRIREEKKNVETK